jgi:hypothetical protein
LIQNYLEKVNNKSIKIKNFEKRRNEGMLLSFIKITTFILYKNDDKICITKKKIIQRTEKVLLSK